MNQVVSKATMTGVFFVAAYLLLTVGAVFYSFNCTGVFCELTIVLPVVPWLFILETVLSNTVWSYFIVVILNSVILYFLGRYVGRLLNEREHRRQLQDI